MIKKIMALGGLLALGYIGCSIYISYKNSKYLDTMESNSRTLTRMET